MAFQSIPSGHYGIGWSFSFSLPGLGPRSVSSISIAVCANIGYDFMTLHGANLWFFVLSIDRFARETLVVPLKGIAGTRTCLCATVPHPLSNGTR